MNKSIRKGLNEIKTMKFNGIEFTLRQLSPVEYNDILLESYDIYDDPDNEIYPKVAGKKVSDLDLTGKEIRLHKRIMSGFNLILVYRSAVEFSTELQDLTEEIGIKKTLELLRRLPFIIDLIKAVCKLSGLNRGGDRELTSFREESDGRNDNVAT